MQYCIGFIDSRDGRAEGAFLRQMHEQLTCGGDLVWVKHGTSQASYRQKRLHLDSEEWHSRRRNSFELTFSLESGPPGALGLRLCNETARGRLDTYGFSGFFQEKRLDAGFSFSRLEELCS